jgi:hypothetical protein
LKKGCWQQPFSVELTSAGFLMDLSGPALGALKARNLLILWLRGLDLNQRPLGYEQQRHTLSAVESIAQRLKNELPKRILST